MIREQEVSPVEVVAAHLARIAEVNPRVNCFCFVYADEAMAEARKAERAVTSGQTLGPLHGVPFALKDLTPTTGKRTTLGSRLYEHWVPDWQPVIVDRLLAAGAILVGKTTTPEFASAGFTASPLWGVTRNPWNLARSPGGSSGGSAAAVAADCVPFAEGTDIGGSVRAPAALCGIVGLKPSLGRIPCDLMPTTFDTMLHFGPLTRTVADAALFLNVTQGPDDRDILSLPELPPISVPPPADVRGLRLALSVDLGFFEVDPHIAANTRAAAQALEGLGAVVEELDLGWTSAMTHAWYDFVNALLAALYGHHLPERRHEMDPNTVSLIEAGQRLSAVDLKQRELVRTELWRSLAAVLGTHDALLCPTTALPAQPVELSDADFYYDGPDGRYRAVDMTMPFNLTAQCPVLSVPSGATPEGLPTGLQIVGRRYDDAGVLRIGAALEKVLPWSHRRPPVR